MPHRALLEKLASTDLNKYPIKWVASYLTGQKRQIVRNGSCSDFSPLNISGVPQGSVLGPLLFIIYINEAAHCMTADSKLVMYTDDNLLYRPVCSTADLICLLEETNSLG